MRLLHLISSSGLFGAERVALVLCKALKKKGLNPIMGVIKNKTNPNTEIADEAKSSGLSTVIFPCNGQFDLKLIFQIRKFLKKNKIDIVHSHGYKSNFFALLGSYQIAQRITTNHNWLTSHWRLKIYCWLDSILMRKFDRIVGVSEQIKEDMIKKKIPAGKISVIDNGIDLERFQELTSSDNTKNEFGISCKDVVIGAIGSLIQEKGFIYLLDAAKKVVKKRKNVKFLIVGGGGLRGELEKKAKEIKLDSQIIFTGIRKDIPKILSIMDIFVLSSIKEGLPMVLLEAMAAKKPIVATRVGAVPKILKNNVTGVLVKSGNSNEIATGILELLSNPQKAFQLIENAYHKVRTELSGEVMCEEYVKLYRELN